jgi:hypothetical protein
VVFSRFVAAPQEDVGKILLAESEGQIGENAEERDEENDNDPENALLAIEGLCENAGDDASVDAEPDEEEGKVDPAIPVGGMKAEAIEQIRHGKRGAGKRIAEGLLGCNPFPERVAGK